MSLSAVCFEILLLWLCCPWLAFLVVFSLSSRFRQCSLTIYLGCLMFCIPFYAFYVVFITPIQSSLSFDIPILITALLFYLISHKVNQNSHSVLLREQWLKMLVLIIYLLAGLTTLLSLSWMGL